MATSTDFTQYTSSTTIAANTAQPTVDIMALTAA
jgi:hypothetical protein